ncbi:glycosyltransferase family 4 protein [Adhaeribacter aquaticus]|uniref:glycosyltransferase family 4 protein n=1 Tax=Adhaeribacter aquaticus TaxID=299567 RepID=UPI0004045570|nr:glycosyltransferase family 1 protein [Adhaeribacter aquaticus]
MKVAIDCRSLRKSPSGIPNFLVSAINSIATLNPSWTLFLLSNEPFNPELEKQLLISDNIKIIIQPFFVAKKIALIWLVFKVRTILKQIKPDLFWAPAFLTPPFIPSNIKTLVTVHDMVYKEHKETMSLANRVYFDLFHDISIKNANFLWSNSTFTKEGIIKYFPERKCKDIFSGFFINTSIFKKDEINSEEKAEICLKHNLNDKFLLFVGTLEPRKNLTFLLSLMPQLALLGFDLLIVGANGWGETKIKNVVEAEGFPKEKVKFAGFLTTDELIKIFNVASVYVSTSLNEGFGMPQLEAMACGCPVVSPHNSAMVEVVAGAGETVSSWDKVDWVKTINKVYLNRDSYIEAGFKRVEEYNREYVIRKLQSYLNGEF